jgi:hypothetical protein
MRNAPPREFLQARSRRLTEGSNDYPSLSLNDRCRLIECRDGIQWIVQHRNCRSDAETVSSSDWRGRSYCRTRDGLIACCDRLCGPIDPAARVALVALPDRFVPGCLPINVKTETNRDARRVCLAA